MNMIFAIWKVGQPQTYKGITIDNIVIPTTRGLSKGHRDARRSSDTVTR
jgi:hypothetical protein